MEMKEICRLAGGGEFRAGGWRSRAAWCERDGLRAGIYLFLCIDGIDLDSFGWLKLSEWEWTEESGDAFDRCELHQHLIAAGEWKWRRYAAWQAEASSELEAGALVQPDVNATGCSQKSATEAVYPATEVSSRGNHSECCKVFSFGDDSASGGVTKSWESSTAPVNNVILGELTVLSFQFSVNCLVTWCFDIPSLLSHSAIQLPSVMLPWILLPDSNRTILIDSLPELTYFMLPWLSRSREHFSSLIFWKD
jgi:hypothetical protein